MAIGDTEVAVLGPSEDVIDVPGSGSSGSGWGLGGFFNSVGEGITSVFGTKVGSSNQTVANVTAGGLMSWIFPKQTTTAGGAVAAPLTFWQKWGRAIILGAVLVAAVVFWFKRKRRK